MNLIRENIFMLYFMSIPGSPESVFHPLFSWDSRHCRQKSGLTLPNIQLAPSVAKSFLIKLNARGDQSPTWRPGCWMHSLWSCAATVLPCLAAGPRETTSLMWRRRWRRRRWRRWRERKRKRGEFRQKPREVTERGCCTMESFPLLRSLCSACSGQTYMADNVKFQVQSHL